MIPNTQLKYSSHHRFRHENIPFDIDEWYPLLAPITFKTFFYPLKKEQAEAIIAYYRSIYFHRNEFASSHSIILEDLEHQIDQIFKSNPTLNKKGGFLRLCGRSPKDGDPYQPMRFFKEYQDNLEKISSTYNLDKNKGNTKVMAISKTHYLIVRNGKECLSLLLSSERVYFDLLDWIRFGGKEQICLREWDNDLDYDNEYRAFVYNNKLTAISQYDHYGKYDHVIQDREKIERMIHQFWEEEVKTRMKVNDYIIDFGYVNHSIIMIELSPFLECTGASMFRWHLDSNELCFGNGRLKVALKEFPDVDFLADQWEKKWHEIPDYKTNFFKESWKEWFTRIFYNNLFFFSKNNLYFVFVGSLLKRGFFWNKKYLSFAQFVDVGKLNDYSILIDTNGMGWIVNGDKMVGELWKVNENDLNDIEYFYGFSQKVEVTIETKNSVINNVVCFVRNDLNEIEGKIVEEYTLENQIDYNSIGHSISLQEKYMNTPFRYPLHKNL